MCKKKHLSCRKKYGASKPIFELNMNFVDKIFIYIKKGQNNISVINNNNWPGCHGTKRVYVLVT